MFRQLSRMAPLILAALLVSRPLPAEVLINEALSLNLLGITDEDGEASDWIELYNTGPMTAHLGGWGLSDDVTDPFQWIFPVVDIPPGEALLVFASGKNRLIGELHTNFKLDDGGELVLLSDDDGEPKDLLDTGVLPPDVSRGRSPDGGLAWFFFSPPTPGGPNGEAFPAIAAAPLVSPEGGLPDSPLSVEISSPSPEAEIRYTLDAFVPDEDSPLYTEPILVDTSTIVRARCYEEGLLASPTRTRSYLFDEGSELPIVSLVADPDYLWDEDLGIYVLGDDYQNWWPYYGANFWEDWERHAHIEFWEPGGQPGFTQEIGIEIHGAWSRANAQKSLRLIPRAGYGAELISHPVLGPDEISEFHFLILRNAGNDWSKSHLRDAFAHSVAGQFDLDVQAYQPCALFLNGEYWGIHNIRERQDKHYLASHHGVDPNELDILERRNAVVEGDGFHHIDLLAYLETSDMAADSTLAHVQTLMDTENFSIYNAVEIYLCNVDWPGNNTRYWRPRTADGRWRWMLWDLDSTQGLDGLVDFNCLAWALKNIEGEIPLPWATFILRRLVENPVWRRDFINRFADLMNEPFLPDQMLAALAEACAAIEAEMPRHLETWDRYSWIWDYHIELMQNFLGARPAYMRQHILEEFELAGTLTLGLDVDPPGSGSIELTEIAVDSTWSGSYFLGNPVPLKAVPRSGYHFVSWSDPMLPGEQEVLIAPDGDYSVTAIFGEGGDIEPRAVINEINYHSADAFDPGDWVELHNPGTSAMDVSDWIFKDGDDGHAFAIPPDMLIPGDGYLVLCEDLALFQLYFPEVTGAIGDLGFGFSGGGELLRLYDSEGTLYDSVLYDDAPPWPIEPDGGGPTLELIHPELDNALPESWAASVPPFEHGSPGERNSVFEGTGVLADETPPARLALLDPHPNPFNPATSLRFGLPAPARVRLSVHDVRGRRVAVLLDARLDAGWHERTWRPDGLASGIYLARLEIAGQALSRKLVLLK